MLELTAHNVLDYLRQRGWIDNAPAYADVLSGGVSNQVVRITTSQRCFVLKQSRPQLRTRDAWFSDLDRIYREQEVMQALHPFLPGVVPKVLYVDRPNYVYAMSHAPLAAKVWKTELLDGQIDLDLGKKVGQALGRIHQVSAQNAKGFEAFRDHNVYVQLRVDPFYRRVQERRPECAAAIEPIIQDMLTLKEALCHGDYTPKNILVHGSSFTLVDYETAHLGDPTMDLGLFLTHLTLKAVRAPSRSAELIALMRAFWQSYCGVVRFCARQELERRGVRHLCVCLLARIDGTSPVDYLPEEAKRELVRQLGRAILLDHAEKWEDVWQHAEQALNRLAK
jgi:aminoglycoside phosphotransferase (APT) family kinase protein